ncbi:hypothetical protein [Brevundimonas aurifodinae]|uniref:Diguanylate cyclase n=2 Tax=Brevundimonas TaxID=41275 RepID=A0ABV1NKI7_9CAUL|nr:MAG: hypothetical protein B7Z01_13055 [Brevundimonas subvibrioides]
MFLAYVPRRLIAPAIGLTSFLALMVVAVDLPANWEEVAFAGCWISVVAISLSVHLPNPPNGLTVLAIAANAGVWVGLVVAAAGRPLDLLFALPLMIAAIPAIYILRTPVRLGVKIMASWLAAVAILAGSLPFTPTAGYEPDHMQ